MSASLIGSGLRAFFGLAKTEVMKELAKALLAGPLIRGIRDGLGQARDWVTGKGSGSGGTADKPAAGPIEAPPAQIARPTDTPDAEAAEPAAPAPAPDPDSFDFTGSFADAVSNATVAGSELADRAIESSLPHLTFGPEDPDAIRRLEAAAEADRALAARRESLPQPGRADPEMDDWSGATALAEAPQRVGRARRPSRFDLPAPAEPMPVAEAFAGRRVEDAPRPALAPAPRRWR